MRLGDHLYARIIQNLADQPAAQPSDVIAVSGNGGQEFAQDLFGGDQQSVRTIYTTRGISPRIAWEEDREPIERVGKDPPHLFGVP